MVAVPSADDVLTAELKKKELEATRRRTADVGTYGLSQASELPTDAQLTVNCDRCQTARTVALRRQSRRVRCRKCGNQIYVPGDVRAADESLPPQRSDKTDAAAMAEVRDDRRVSSLATPDARPQPETQYLYRAADIRREESSVAPESLYFAGVWSFPFRASTRSRWLFLSLGCTLLGALVGAMFHVLSAVSGYGGVVLAFLAMPAIWIGLWTCSYAAACGISIIEDTANGLDVVVNWLEPNWKEWVPRLGFFLYLGTLSVTTCMLLARGMFELTGWFVVPMLVTIQLMFPWLILSALESGSVLMPFSGPVTTSLNRSWGAWCGYQLVCLAANGVLAGLLLAGATTLPIATFVLAGPLVAAMLLINCRLLGRLGWAITRDGETDDSVRRRRKKRRQQGP